MIVCARFARFSLWCAPSSLLAFGAAAAAYSVVVGRFCLYFSAFDNLILILFIFCQIIFFFIFIYIRSIYLMLLLFYTIIFYSHLIVLIDYFFLELYLYS